MENCRKFIEHLVKSIHSAIIKSVDLVDGQMVEGKRGGDKDESFLVLSSYEVGSRDVLCIILGQEIVF